MIVQADRWEHPSSLRALTASLRAEGPAVSFNELSDGIKLHLFARDDPPHLRILRFKLLKANQIARIKAAVLVLPGPKRIDVNAELPGQRHGRRARIELLERADDCASLNRDFFTVRSPWASARDLTVSISDDFRPQVTATIDEAMKQLGHSYPRERAQRQAKLVPSVLARLRDLDDQYYALKDIEAGGFENAADNYAASIRTFQED
jgi:hypothetical protein